MKGMGGRMGGNRVEVGRMKEIGGRGKVQRLENEDTRRIEEREGGIEEGIKKTRRRLKSWTTKCEGKAIVSTGKGRMRKEKKRKKAGCGIPNQNTRRGGRDGKKVRKEDSSRQKDAEGKSEF